MAVSSALVSVTGEPSDDEVVGLACDLLNSNKSKLYLLYVIEVERGLPIDAEIAPATAKGEEVLNHLEQLARRHKFRPEAELVQARRAGLAVVKEAVDKNVDVIVLGSGYRQPYGSFSLGDTIPYVLKNAPCRVVVWRDSVSPISSNGHGG